MHREAHVKTDFTKHNTMSDGTREAGCMRGFAWYYAGRVHSSHTKCSSQTEHSIVLYSRTSDGTNAVYGAGERISA